MIVALLLAAAAAAAVPTTAIDAERAFAADAQKMGQWTAFRAYAATDALMFTPQPVNAHAFLKELKDPPSSVYWWPGRSYVSCDGTVAVNTGPWVRGFGKAVGHFTTVWKRQPDGSWKWLYDAGQPLPAMRAEGGDIRPVTAACPRRGANAPVLASAGLSGTPKRGGGASNDHSIVWKWAVGAKGDARFTAWMWDGKAYRPVVSDRIAAGSE